MKIFEQVSTKTPPTKYGWYDTDKEKLFWDEVKQVWSCRDDRVSEEYPKYWYRKIPIDDVKDLEISMLDITSSYYIYVYHNLGNTGGRSVRTIDEQPKEGFKTEEEAEYHLKKLILERTGCYFTRNWYKFTILKTFNSLNEKY